MLWLTFATTLCFLSGFLEVENIARAVSKTRAQSCKLGSGFFDFVFPFFLPLVLCSQLNHSWSLFSPDALMSSKITLGEPFANYLNAYKKLSPNTCGNPSEIPLPVNSKRSKPELTLRLRCQERIQSKGCGGLCYVVKNTSQLL